MSCAEVISGGIILTTMSALMVFTALVIGFLTMMDWSMKFVRRLRKKE